MNISVVKYLACPVCKGDFFPEANNGMVEFGLLRCLNCCRDYPVIRGIPRLLPDSLMTVLATQIPEDFSRFNFSYPISKRIHRDDFETEDFLHKQRATMDAFAYEWNEFTELTKEFINNEYTRTLAPHSPDIVRNKAVLEAGAGIGFFLEEMNNYGASTIFGMNMGLDVEIARKRTSKYSNITIVQGDIFHLPFKSQFDFVISHGVIHHLPEPESGFSKLISILKPKGEVFIWVYGRDPVVPIIELIRFIFCKLPKPVAKYLSLPFAIPLLSLKMLYLSLNVLPGLKKMAKFVPYKQYAIRNFKEMHCTIMDKLFVPVVNYYDANELKLWFDKAELTSVSIVNRDGNSWSCYGVKSK